MGRNNKTIFDGSLVNRINDISRSFETNIGKNNLICKILTFVQKNLRGFYHLIISTLIEKLKWI